MVGAAESELVSQLQSGRKKKRKLESTILNDYLQAIENLWWSSLPERRIWYAIRA